MLNPKFQTMEEVAYQRPNNHYFSDIYNYTGKVKIPTRIQLIKYNAESVTSESIDVNTPSFKAHIDEKSVNWFKVQGLVDNINIARMVREFGLHNLDIKDVLTHEEVVKIEENEDSVFIVMKSCSLDKEGNIRSEHVCIYFDEKTVITFNESAEDLFVNVNEGLKKNTMHLRTKNSGLLAAFAMNAIMADLVETAIKVENNLEDIEDILLNSKYDQKNIGAKIQECLHAYLIIRKNIYPLKDDFHILLKTKGCIIEGSNLFVFKDISDQLQFIIQIIDNSKEILSSLVDLYVSNNDLRMNEVMKHLTVVSTIFIPITFLVGVWGMNFDFMPELNWKYGYLFAWAVLAGVAGITWFFMRRKRWF